MVSTAEIAKELTAAWIQDGTRNKEAREIAQFYLSVYEELRTKSQTAVEADRGRFDRIDLYSLLLLCLAASLIVFPLAWKYIN
jgi:hypothetical protein